MTEKRKCSSVSMPPVYGALDCVYYAAQEKIAGYGEDSFCYGISEEGVLLGVFDGCGGSGAKKYPVYQNRTGAYMGARAVAGATRQWFEQLPPLVDCDENGKALKDAIVKSMTVCRKNCGNQDSKIRGSISKKFPTTAAVARCTVLHEEMLVECYWAGDSRVYLLDEDGLAQLTADDLDNLDAYENISGDGVLTNVISASKPFALHGRSMTPRKPFFIFAATDGCFGYIPSPMEFEEVLLEQLVMAESMKNFEEGLRLKLAETAGDDFTLVGAAFGFDTFLNMQACLEKRYHTLIRRYLSGISQSDPESRRRIWKQYQEDYYRFYTDETEAAHDK